MQFIELIFWLIVGHAVADYALQSPYMAAAKSRHSSEGSGIWFWILFMHACVHGGMVAYATGYVYLGLAEIVLHMWIDYSKTEGRFGSGPKAHIRDQQLHILCKMLWAVITLTLTSG